MVIAQEKGADTDTAMAGVGRIFLGLYRGSLNLFDRPEAAWTLFQMCCRC
jgi:hypothetical protein